MFERPQRREIITLLGSAAAALAWFRPLGARAQQGERVRRVSIILNNAEGDPEGEAHASAFAHALQESGWTAARGVAIEYRWAAGNAERVRQYAEEAVARAPDVILATGGFGVGPLLRLTNSIPIVFISVVDPVGAGYVESLARPGGNATGFTNFEYGIASKWLEILKQIAPGVTRAAVLRDPSIPSGSGQLGSIQTAAFSLGMEVRPLDARNADDMERVVAAFAREGHGSLLVTAGAPALTHRERIVALAARYKLPAVYPYRYFVRGGGLVSYGPDTTDPYRRAAGYVDRILKGEKPADLPVQAPTKYELVINLKTANALGLDLPAQLLARADGVIE